MTTLSACPICATPRPTDRRNRHPWCCPLVCYRTFHDLDQPSPEHDTITTTWPPTNRQPPPPDSPAKEVTASR